MAEELEADAFISRAIKLGEGLSTVTGNGVTLLRERYLFHLQTQLGELCRNGANWPWMRTERGLRITADDGEYPLPQDFSAFGEKGQVHLYTTGWEWKHQLGPEDENVGNTAWQAGVASAAPRRFWESGSADGLAATFIASDRVTETTPTMHGVPKLRVYPIPDQAYILWLTYEMRRPTITDAASSSGLRMVPADFQKDVLMPMVLELAAIDRGDSTTAAAKRKQWDAAIKAQGRHQRFERMRTQRVPRFFGGTRRRSLP